VQALNFPSAEMIHKTSSLLTNLPAASSVPHPLYEAFWLCNQMFKELGTPSTGGSSSTGMATSSKRIFLFTSCDTVPCPPKSTPAEALAQALQYVKELQNAEVEIELFPIRAKGKIFDYSLFYANVITVDPEEANQELLTGPSDKLADLAVRIRRREFKKKRLGRVDFRIGEGVIIGTQL
jgi:hypothetical protein